MALSNYFNQKLFIAEVKYKGWSAENATTYKTRDAFQKRKKKKKKNFPLQDPENATIYKTDAFQKNILKLKFKKKLTNIYIYDKT